MLAFITINYGEKVFQRGGLFKFAARREYENFSHADLADYADFMGGCAFRVSNFIFSPRKLQAPTARLISAQGASPG